MTNFITFQKARDVLIKRYGVNAAEAASLASSIMEREVKEEKIHTVGQFESHLDYLEELGS